MLGPGTLDLFRDGHREHDLRPASAVAHSRAGCVARRLLDDVHDSRAVGAGVRRGSTTVARTVSSYTLDFAEGTPGSIDVAGLSSVPPINAPIAALHAISFSLPPTGTLNVGPVMLDSTGAGTSFVVSVDPTPASPGARLPIS